MELNEFLKKIQNCTTSIYFKKEDIQKNKLKNNVSSISIANIKVFEFKESNKKVLIKKQIVDKLKIQNLVDYSITDNLNKMILFKNDSALLYFIENYSNKLFVLCLYETREDEFGCCGRFIECSNQKKCINTNREMYVGCAYRKNLEKGHIFYGENCNIGKEVQDIQTEKNDKIEFTEEQISLFDK